MLDALNRQKTIKEQWIQIDCEHVLNVRLKVCMVLKMQTFGLCLCVLTWQNTKVSEDYTTIHLWDETLVFYITTWHHNPDEHDCIKWLLSNNTTVDIHW